MLAVLSACNQQQSNNGTTVASTDPVATSENNPTSGSAKDVPLDSLLSADQKEALRVAEMTDENREVLRRALWNAYVSGFTAASNARSTPTAPETNILGTFNGWDGQTIVKLLNGEIWRQTSYYYEYHFSVNPGVHFHQSGEGWKMQVDGTQGLVDVERLK
ncbi:MAG TPA: hypothetical protein VGV09_13215 [Steroidobacteraceae bacterium]|nr:hypothetical protein [Steroidobacteraceae bacterium]